MRNYWPQYDRICSNKCKDDIWVLKNNEVLGFPSRTRSENYHDNKISKKKNSLNNHHLNALIPYPVLGAFMNGYIFSIIPQVTDDTFIIKVFGWSSSRKYVTSSVLFSSS